MPSSTSRTTTLAACAVLALATSTAQAIPLQLGCLQATALALADPAFSTCIQTPALGSLLPYFFGSSNLSIAAPVDEYLEAYCLAPLCNATTYETVFQSVNAGCGSALDSVGLTNETLSFLISNDAAFKAAVCVPADGAANSTIGANSTVAAPLNATSADNSTTFSYCLPSLMNSFETVLGQNLTVELLVGVASGNVSFDSIFPALNASSLTNSSSLTNVSSLAGPLVGNDTLASAICTGCVRDLILTLEDSFGNGTVSNGTLSNGTLSNTASSLLTSIKAGAEAICGDSFFGNSTANSTAGSSLTATGSVAPIPVSTRSVVQAGTSATSAASGVASSAASAATGVVTSAASAASAPVSEVPIGVLSGAASVTASLGSAVTSAVSAAV